MSMLAEPRRKQKWTLNPRGKQWSQDSNKFGQKMLEKMGWTNGKGLGANEQGITEHVKVNYKNNQSGIGFKDTGDQWTQHQADFNHFLTLLQEQNSSTDAATEIKETETAESLELKSKQSRARVHYHKFTRGKDVKKYSPKDLANIFGKRDLKDAVETPKAKELVKEVTVDPKGSKDCRGGVLTIKGGNIDEYFRNKLPNFSKKENSNEGDDSPGEYEPRLGFGFSSINDLDDSHASKNSSEQNKLAKIKGETGKSNSGFAFANEGLDLDYPEIANISKKRNSEFAFDNQGLSLKNREDGAEKCTLSFSKEGFVNPALNLNNTANDENNGAEFEVSRVEFGLDNNALDLSDEMNKKKRVTFNDRVEYNTDIIKKKKGKGKVKAKLDKFEVDNAKLKKKQKEVAAATEFISANEAEGFVNEALEIEAISNEVNDNELNERKTKKSKRKKNRRTLGLETIAEAAEESSQIDESEIGEAILLDEAHSRKNKKLKRNPDSKINLEINADIMEVPNEALGTKKRDKKDKKKVLQEEPPPEKESDKKKEKLKKSEEAEITVLREISKKMKKCKKNKIENESRNSDIQQEAIEIIVKKTKDKKRSRSNTEDEDIMEIQPKELSDQLDISRNSSTMKRKNNSGEDGVKLTKRSKLDDQAATENTENIEQNGSVSTNSIPLNPQVKKDKKSKKIFKLLFTKAPILHFSGSNINEIPGYGAAITEMKR